MAPPSAETDPSVCYRHPDRTSWTLCSRCGRTICPECQILTPAGVRCPECVKEEGGSVRWEPAAAAERATKARTRARAPRRPGALAARIEASERPVATIGVGGTAVILWILGFFTGNAPFLFLAALPGTAWQIWRYPTSVVAYPAVPGAGIVFVLLSIAIFVFLGWGAERQFGRRQLLLLILLSGSAAAALSLLIGSGEYGLVGPIWGIAGAYVITVWNHAAARNRLLISLAIWFVLSLFLSGNILGIIGGLAAGVGLTLLRRVAEDRPRWSPSTPYLIVAAGIGVLVVLAIVSSFLMGTA